MLSKTLIVAILVCTALAQQTEWGQCGGQGWTGPTTCVSGTTCVYSNPYYSQCLPGPAPTTLATVTMSKPASSTSKPVTSVPNPTTSTPTSAVKSTSTPSPTSAGGWQYLISFGDSYSQTGFDISGAHASASDPLGNPAFPGYTTTGGYNWIDYAIAKYNRSLILSYNFAYGGATTDASLVTPYESTVLSLVDQVSEFSSNLASHPSYCPWTSTNALFAIWIGVNDVGNAFGNSDWNTLAPQIIQRYFQEVQILYNAGARNFLFLTVPPIQKSPLVLAESSSTQSQEGAAVSTYNSLLTSAVSSFQSANSGVTAYVYDTTTPFNTAINNPSAYGASSASCYNSDGVSCLWWNNYHPGQAIHNLVAQGVAALTGI